MPGVNLNLDLPTGSDTMADVVAKTAVALSAIQDDLTERVTPSEINVNTSFSLAGNAITNVGSVQLVAGNSPTSEGAFYFEDGEFYVIDSTGVVQLTSAGSLNAAALGSIVGDYGGVNPARITYDDASGEYRFTEDTGVYADLIADDVVLMGAAGSVRLGVASGITTTRQFLFDTLPTSGVSPLVYQASDSTVRDGLVTRATGTALLTSANLSADLAAVNVTVTGKVNHGDKTLVIPVVYPDAVLVSGSYSNNGSSPGVIQALSSVVYYPLRGIDATKRVKSIIIHNAAAPASSVVYTLALVGALGFFTFLGTGETVTSSAQSPTLTLATPRDLTNSFNTGDVTLWLKVETGGSSTAKPVQFAVAFDSV